MACSLTDHYKKRRKEEKNSKELRRMSGGRNAMLAMQCKEDVGIA